MSTSRRLLLFAAIVAAVCSAAALEPILSFSVSPEPGSHDLVPTAPPLVLNSTAAFLCWSYFNSYDAHCCMVSPADPTFQAPWVNLSTANADQFQDLPLPLFSNPVSAIYSVSQATGSYFAASSSTTALQPLSRNVSTARCATDPFSHTAFIPYGVKEGDDALLAIATLPEKGNTALYALQPWSFKNKSYPNGLSLLHDVIWYRGLLLFMHNNTFYTYNSTTGHMIFSVPDPCGVGLERNSMNLARGTFGFDANGDLDAFIIYGNTSTASQAQFVVCRISHNDGNTKWKYVMADDFVVEDIIGGSGVLLLSGYAVTTGAPQYTTHILDAATNVSYGFIPRSFQDKQSFPSFVPPSVVPPGCGGAIVLQQHTNLTAFCFNPIIINRTVRAPLWSVTVGCLRRPIYEAISNQILCVDGTYVSSVETIAGSLVWQIARSVTFQPMIMVENTVPYLFVFDSDANLVGYQLPYVSPSTPTPGAPPQGDAPSSGLSGGAAAGIAIGVILAVVAGAGTAFYFTRSRRRYTSADSKSMNQEYGSLT